MEAHVVSQRWQEILENTLQPKLQEVEREREAHKRAAGEYADLVVLIGALRVQRDQSTGGAMPLEAHCEVVPGSGVFEPVEVPDATRIHVDVGEGKYEEFTLDVALAQAQQRQEHFERLARECQTQVDKIQETFGRNERGRAAEESRRMMAAML